MPELPEVETIVNDLKDAKLIGKQISSVTIYWDRSISGISPDEFTKKIKSQKIKGISRRGKFIVITLENDTLLIHLRMTGKIVITDHGIEDAYTHERVKIIFHDKTCLHFIDQRKFGKLYLFADPSEKFDTLGLEPLSETFTLQAFKSLIKGNSKIKPFLLNQKHLSGIGNIYADEALWLSEIHPERAVSSLTNNEIKKLHLAIQTALKSGITNQGTSLGTNKSNYARLSGIQGNNQNLLNVFRKQNQACPRCGNTIIKIIVAQRGTHLCPHCQKKHS